MMFLGFNGLCFLGNKHIMCFLIRFVHELCTGPCQRSLLIRFLKDYEFRGVDLPFDKARATLAGEQEPSLVFIKVLPLQVPAFII